MQKIKVKGENILNLPNLLSLYRLLVFPLILYFAFSDNEYWFIVFICISLVSDILDGNIARIYDLQTEFGAALDNLGDICTYIAAFIGIFLFKWAEIEPHAWILYLFLIMLVVSYVVAFIRFGKIPGLHLYMSVASGYLQGVFLFILFAIGFYPWMYYLAIGWGVIAYIEKTIVLFLLDDIKIGVKGLYWMLWE